MVKLSLLLIVIGALALLFQTMTIICRRRFVVLSVEVEEGGPRFAWLTPMATAAVLIAGMVMLTL
jgi:hypothetical protein